MKGRGNIGVVEFKELWARLEAKEKLQPSEWGRIMFDLGTSRNILQQLRE